MEMEKTWLQPMAWSQKQVLGITWVYEAGLHSSFIQKPLSLRYGIGILMSLAPHPFPI